MKTNTQRFKSVNQLLLSSDKGRIWQMWKAPTYQEHTKYIGLLGKEQENRQ